MNSALDYLKRYWSHDSFRNLQDQIIQSALNKRDTLAILPTGAGKSICFQIPALMSDGVCLVISPLIALMKDQVENLRGKGIKALVVHSGMTHNEVDAILDNAIYGNYKFLYLSPERLRSDIFKVRVQKMNISYIVVDEAHCISHWGYDFRPDYLMISNLYELTGRVPVIALTATATPVVAEDIMDKLLFRERNIFKGDFIRGNLSYVVRNTEDKNGMLLRIAKSLNGCGIVYVRERRKAQEIASFLAAQGLLADSYHAGFSAAERARKQERWFNGEVKIIVSTNAFGMGIDKGDVRFVCHFDLPESLESYFQEAGRAGRDGKLSYAVLLWNSSDVKKIKYFISLSFPPIEYIKEIYQKLYRFFDYAYGSGKGAVQRFSIEEFAGKFKLSAARAYYAAKYLDSDGYIKLTEEIDNPSRITFNVNRDELYIIQLKNESLDALIKILLRLYPGIFSEFIAVNEEHIARTARNSKANIVSMLERLARMGVISYIPGAKSPLIIFNNERLDEKSLEISAERYEQRLEEHSSRVSSVIEYAKQDSLCRSLYMIRYFGQEYGDACEICDVCKSKQKANNQASDDSDMERKLIELLMESPRTLEEIASFMNDYSGSYIRLLKELADTGGIEIDGEIVSLVKS